MSRKGRKVLSWSVFCFLLILFLFPILKPQPYESVLVGAPGYERKASTVKDDARLNIDRGFGENKYLGFRKVDSFAKTQGLSYVSYESDGYVFVMNRDNFDYTNVVVAVTRNIGGDTFTYRLGTLQANEWRKIPASKFRHSITGQRCHLAGHKLNFTQLTCNEEN